MKTDILDINGKKIKSLELPAAFSEQIRNDLIQMVLEIKKNRQPYAPSLVAGKQHSASGRIIHRRHVWRTGYGKGMSRVPRKTMSRSGSQFNWIAAEISSAVGGRRAHPPKVASMMNHKKINKKEMKMAFGSALSATANEKIVSGKYGRLENQKIQVPFVVESKIISLKTKEFLSSLKKILGEKLFEVAIKIKKVRSGVGKSRGRKYKGNAGLLFVLGNDEKLKANVVDSKNAGNLSIVDIAKGGPGRLVIYTEKSIQDIGKRLGEEK